MSPKPQVEHSEYAERTAKIRLLCQGDPIDVAKIQEQFTADDFEAFGVEDAAEMYDLIKITAGSLLDDPDAVAIRNALGLGATKTLNLTERRAELLETVDITMRALQSREAKGAELLARQMEVVKKMRPSLAEGVDVGALVGEVQGLKEQLSELAEKIEKIVSSEFSWQQASHSIRQRLEKADKAAQDSLLEHARLIGFLHQRVRWLECEVNKSERHPLYEDVDEYKWPFTLPTLRKFTDPSEEHK
ncbi:hypothetical protein [Rhodococcus aetherivorans]|uniref:hypothetical protein n=1 Tax=Rhodococcus aetherivorans TaxID=191292 RepID=UPI00388F7B1E